MSSIGKLTVKIETEGLRDLKTDVEQVQKYVKNLQGKNIKFTIINFKPFIDQLKEIGVELRAAREDSEKLIESLSNIGAAVGRRGTIKVQGVGGGRGGMSEQDYKYRFREMLGYADQQRRKKDKERAAFLEAKQTIDPTIPKWKQQEEENKEINKIRQTRIANEAKSFAKQKAQERERLRYLAGLKQGRADQSLSDVITENFRSQSRGGASWSPAYQNAQMRIRRNLYEADLALLREKQEQIKNNQVLDEEEKRLIRAVSKRVQAYETDQRIAAKRALKAKYAADEEQFIGKARGGASWSLNYAQKQFDLQRKLYEADMERLRAKQNQIKLDQVQEAVEAGMLRKASRFLHQREVEKRIANKGREKIGYERVEEKFVEGARGAAPWAFDFRQKQGEILRNLEKQDLQKQRDNNARRIMTGITNRSLLSEEKDEIAKIRANKGYQAYKAKEDAKLPFMERIAKKYGVHKVPEEDRGLAAELAARNLVLSLFTTAAIIRTAIEPIRQAAKFETLRSQLDIQTRNPARTSQKMGEYTKFAADTPFSLEDVMFARNKLEAFGGAALNSSRNMNILGDATTAMGQELKHTSFWFARLYTLIQQGAKFGEAAHNLSELGLMDESTRTKMERMRQEGKSGTEIFQVYLDYLSKYKGAMTLAMDTTAGQLSKTSDNFNLFFAQMGEPMNAATKQVLYFVNIIADHMSPELMKATSQVFGFVGGITALIVVGGLLVAILKSIQGYVVSMTGWKITAAAMGTFGTQVALVIVILTSLYYILQKVYGTRWELQTNLTAATTEAAKAAEEMKKLAKEREDITRGRIDSVDEIEKKVEKYKKLDKTNPVDAIERETLRKEIKKEMGDLALADPAIRKKLVDEVKVARDRAMAASDMVDSAEQLMEERFGSSKLPDGRKYPTVAKAEEERAKATKEYEMALARKHAFDEYEEETKDMSVSEKMDYLVGTDKPILDPELKAKIKGKKDKFKKFREDEIEETRAAAYEDAIAKAPRALYAARDQVKPAGLLGGEDWFYRSGLANLHPNMFNQEAVANMSFKGLQARSGKLFGNKIPSFFYPEPNADSRKTANVMAGLVNSPAWNAVLVGLGKLETAATNTAKGLVTTDKEWADWEKEVNKPIDRDFLSTKQNKDAGIVAPPTPGAAAVLKLFGLARGPSKSFDQIINEGNALLRRPDAIRHRAGIQSKIKDAVDVENKRYKDKRIAWMWKNLGAENIISQKLQDEQKQPFKSSKLGFSEFYSSLQQAGLEGNQEKSMKELVKESIKNAARQHELQEELYKLFEGAPVDGLKKIPEFADILNEHKTAVGRIDTLVGNLNKLVEDKIGKFNIFFK